jgi:hypothetical protein
MRIAPFTLIFCLSFSVLAQDYKFHSVFIYNFTKYIQWPDDKKTGDFVIGVVGNSGITDYLKSMASTKTVGSQKLVVKTFNSASKVSDCHIVFLPVNESDQFQALVDATSGKTTLVITEKEGLGTEGSGINFVQVDGRWKFELNEAAINAHNLQVSGELKRLAILI